MQHIRLFLSSVALLVALVGTLTFTTSSTAFASSKQQSQNYMHGTKTHAASGGPATHAAQPRRANVTCSGNGCNGKNPATTGCDVGAKTIQTAVFTNSYVELRYSPTCGTNWARTLSRVGPVNLVARTQRRIDGLTYTFSSRNSTSTFSAMVYAPTTPARACGGVNGISGCTAYV